MRAAVCVILALSIVGGCSGGARREHARESLKSIADAEKVTLYSLDFRTDQEPGDAGRFHGYPVLGSIDVSDASRRGAIVAAMSDGIERFRGESGHNCFWPRHGIRAERGGKATDYVICFECAQIEVYDANGSKIHSMLTTKQPQPTLDRPLKAAGIALAPALNSFRH